MSRAAAEAEYGVVLTGADDEAVVDVASTEQLRASMRSSRGELPFFDRGPGFTVLSGGQPAAEVDTLS